MIWRDYAWSGGHDDAFLHYTMESRCNRRWSISANTIATATALIENGGFPDQTYEHWVARAKAPTCGGLTWPRFAATAEIARNWATAARGTYDALFKKAQAAYIKNLWNGTYFDTTREAPITPTGKGEQLRRPMYANLTDWEIWFPRRCGSQPCNGFMTST